MYVCTFIWAFVGVIAKLGDAILLGFTVCCTAINICMYINVYTYIRYISMFYICLYVFIWTVALTRISAQGPQAESTAVDLEMFYRRERLCNQLC